MLAHKRPKTLSELINRAQEFIIKEEAYQTNKAMFATLSEKEEQKNDSKGDLLKVIAKRKNPERGLLRVAVFPHIAFSSNCHPTSLTKSTTPIYLFAYKKMKGKRPCRTLKILLLPPRLRAPHLRMYPFER